MDLLKSLPYAIAAYTVISIVLTSYIGSLLIRSSNAMREIERLEKLRDSTKSVDNENGDDLNE